MGAGTETVSPRASEAFKLNQRRSEQPAVEPGWDCRPPEVLPGLHGSESTPSCFLPPQKSCAAFRSGPAPWVLLIPCGAQKERFPERLRAAVSQAERSPQWHAARARATSAGVPHKEGGS